MAVYAAHLTRTLQGTPTVFQVTAQEALGSTVKPALRKVVEFLAATYPNKCGWCLHWYDEVYLLFDCCLQYYYLKHYERKKTDFGHLRQASAVFVNERTHRHLLPERGLWKILADETPLNNLAASFSESFYELLRVPTSSSSEFNSGQQLPVYLERASLALLVLVPYLRDRLERIVERWREDDEDGRLGKSSCAAVRRAAVHVYSTVHTLYSCTRLVQLARYTCGRTRSHAPALAALGLTLKYAAPRDQDEHTWGDLMRSVAAGQIGSAVVTFPMLGSLCLRAVEYGAFVVQFLRWWDARAAPAHALPAPPPPARDDRALRWKNKCPICLQSWKIPTVLPVSGYIFCYTCISRHMRSHSACPVTRCPAAENSLVRLYID